MVDDNGVGDSPAHKQYVTMPTNRETWDGRLEQSKESA